MGGVVGSLDLARMGRTAEDVTMSVMLQTADVPIRARAEYVHEVVGEVLGPLDVRTGDGKRYRTGDGNEVPDQVHAAELGAIRVG
jgi:hypothetical protein